MRQSHQIAAPSIFTISAAYGKAANKSPKPVIAQPDQSKFTATMPATNASASDRVAATACEQRRCSALRSWRSPNAASNVI